MGGPGLGPFTWRTILRGFCALQLVQSSGVTCPLPRQLKTLERLFFCPECSVASPFMQHLALHEKCYGRVERKSFSPATFTFPGWALGSVQFQAHMEKLAYMYTCYVAVPSKSVFLSLLILNMTHISKNFSL